MRATPNRLRCCIDFLTDTWERASGTWYQPATKPADAKRLKADPKRTEGTIDFDALKVGNRRSVAKFTEFTEEHPDWFDVWAIPKDKRIPFRKRDPFFEYLATQADMLQPGDMLTIHGYKEGGSAALSQRDGLGAGPADGDPDFGGRQRGLSARANPRGRDAYLAESDRSGIASASKRNG